MLDLYLYRFLGYLLGVRPEFSIGTDRRAEGHNHMTPSLALDEAATPSKVACSARVEAACAALRTGQFVLLTRDDGRHGDLIAAAEYMTPESMAFVVRHSSGFVCVALEAERADELHIPAQLVQNHFTREAAVSYGICVDAADDISTGISAADRSHTVGLLAAASTTAADLSRPGHIATIRTAAGGVLQRSTAAEAAVDLMRLAERRPVALLADLVLDCDGVDLASAAEASRLRVVKLAREPLMSPTPVADFMHRYQIVAVSVADIIRHRRRSQIRVTRAASAQIPTMAGELTAVGYRSHEDGLEHIAFVQGDVSHRNDVLIEVHHESIIGDVVTGDSLAMKLDRLACADAGVLICLRSAEGSPTGPIGSLQLLAHEPGSTLQPEHCTLHTAELTRQILLDLDVHPHLSLSPDQHRARPFGHDTVESR